MAFTPMFFTVMTTWTGHRALDLRQMVHCFRVNGANPTATDLTNLNNELIASLLPKLRGVSCNDLTWESVSSKFMGVVNGVEVTTPITANGSGNRAGNSQPGNVAYAVSWRTGQSGRSFRGRSYLCNLAETDCSGDTITSGLLALVVDFAQTFLLSRVGGKFDPAVGSRVLQGSTKIISYVLEATLDSQRRRLAGRGV